MAAIWARMALLLSRFCQFSKCAAMTADGSPFPTNSTEFPEVLMYQPPVPSTFFIFYKRFLYKLKVKQNQRFLYITSAVINLTSFPPHLGVIQVLESFMWIQFCSTSNSIRKFISPETFEFIIVVGLLLLSLCYQYQPCIAVVAGPVVFSAQFWCLSRFFKFVYLSLVEHTIIIAI